MARSGEPPAESRLKLYWNLIRSSPWYHQLFILLVIAQCAYLVAERCVIFFRYVNLSDPGELRDSIYFFGVIIISVAFCGYYGIHSVLSVNYMELAAYRVLTLWLLVRLVVEFFGNSISGVSECRDFRVSSTCVVLLAVSAVFNTATVVLTFFMLNDLRWKRYKAIGAEVDTQVMYRRFEMFSAVRKVDLQFSLVTLFTGLVYCSTNLSDPTAQYTLGANVALILVEAAWEWLGDTGVKTENETRMYVFWGLSVFLPSFIINVAVDAFTDNDILALASSPTVRITIGVFGLLAVVNRVATVVLSVLLYRSFGERYTGLRRIFEGGRMGKFGRGRAPGAPGAPTGAAAAGAAAEGGGRIGAPTASAAAATRNPVAAATVLRGGGSSSSRGGGPPLPPSTGASGGSIELEMGDLDLGSGGRDPWSSGGASSASASGPGRGAGGPPYVSSPGVGEWGPPSAGSGRAAGTGAGAMPPPPPPAQVRSATGLGRLVRVGTSANPGSAGGGNG